ncbi:hypothetical protein [Streptomyces montanisoli]|uniref:Uncharacterized protein n=1 Tax=Streptomyces montanisoli TaxID=2798581 RepID=A0A940RTZ7_9ACTN|nr:hypothetical protein [Streptomyces montanisoli]MBP0456640.1 hypothetical protein [Streptomyces montanisoli]
MSRSPSRRMLSTLTEAFGADGALIVPKDGSASDGGELPPGSALEWPPCRCGGPTCPDRDSDDGDAPAPGAESAQDPRQQLRARLDEVNKRSRAGRDGLGVDRG